MWDWNHQGYIGHVNGIALSSSAVIVDDATDEDYRIIHVVLSNDEIRALNLEIIKRGGDITGMMIYDIHQRRFRISVD